MNRIIALAVLLCVLFTPAAFADYAYEGEYVKIQEVYPFTNLQLLVDAAEVLGNHSIPFVCETMPVFYNTDFPAATRYCEALRYVQSMGGTVVQRACITLGTEIMRVPTTDKVNWSLHFFNTNGIYPAAYDVQPDFLNYSLVYDINRESETLDDFTTIVNHNLSLGKRYSNLQEYLPVNIPARFETPDISEYVWNRGYESAMSAPVMTVNNNLLIAVAILIFIFLAFIGYGIQRNRRKFMKR